MKPTVSDVDAAVRDENESSTQVLDYRPRRGAALENLQRKADELLRTRSPLELFDVRGFPKPQVPVGGGKWSRSPLAVLHGLGIDQRRDPFEWRAYLNEEFPAREEILAHRRAERERTLRLALGSHLLSVRQAKAVQAELVDITAEKLTAAVEDRKAA